MKKSKESMHTKKKKNSKKVIAKFQICTFQVRKENYCRYKEKYFLGTSNATSICSLQ